MQQSARSIARIPEADGSRPLPAVRRLFAPTSDVHTPEHLQRLLSTIETLREESGENVAKVNATLLEARVAASGSRCCTHCR